MINILLSEFTFQYVSIISDCSRTHYCSGKGIYIPICFYYFQNPQWSRQSQYLIYIPICFYYFGFVYRFYDLRVVFTFQYVSIISVRTALTTWSWLIFTFQYVSIISTANIGGKLVIDTIYIPICFYYFPDFIKVYYETMNLHSNMFLLFPCLPRMSASPLLTFTFQYVSIISLPSPSCKSARLNLHSNMFLLFRSMA